MFMHSMYICNHGNNHMILTPCVLCAVPNQGYSHEDKGVSGCRSAHTPNSCTHCHMHPPTCKILLPTIYSVSLVELLRLCGFVMQVINGTCGNKFVISLILPHNLKRTPLSLSLSLPLLPLSFSLSLPLLPLSLSLSLPLSPSPRLKLVLIQCSAEGVVIDKVECTQLGHMADYFQPHAPGTSAVDLQYLSYLYLYSISLQCISQY